MNKLITLIILISMASAAMAQSDFGIWYSLDAKKKLNKSWSVAAEAEARTHNDNGDLDRISMEIGVGYRAMKYLKLGGGYTFIRDWNPERTTSKGNIVDSYWTTRQRLTFSATGEYKWKRIEFSLREAFQYTHRAETTVGKRSSKGKEKDDEIIEAYDRNVLRSRLQVAVDLNRFEPYASVEWHNMLSDGGGLEKTRLTFGTKCKIIDMISMNIYYRHQDIKDDVNQNILGVGLSFKL